LWRTGNSCAVHGGSWGEKIGKGSKTEKEKIPKPKKREKMRETNAFRDAGKASISRTKGLMAKAAKKPDARKNEGKKKENLGKKMNK